MKESQIYDYDVVIVGAGPAGCSAALALADSGLKVALLDKSTFPRDKVCGDAIPSRAINTLAKISPHLAEAFNGYDKQLLTRHTDVVYNKHTLHLHWKVPAYTCTRLDFDNKLFELVKEYGDCDIYQGEKVVELCKEGNGYVLETDKGNSIHGKLVIGTDGAQSVTAKKLSKFTIDREHHIGAVRAYYKNIAEIQTDKTEMYLDKQFSPGYFWIFPVAGGMANVGFGMISADIVAKKINVRKAFYDFIDTVPELKSRFANADAVSKLEGHSLPLGSRRVIISGERYMLCGDAASLIDPITGEGIGNAMLSGRLAGLRAKECFLQNNFSKEFMHDYDKQVWKALGKELNLRARAQKTFRKMPFLLDAAFALAGWEPVRKMIQEKF